MQVQRLKAQYGPIDVGLLMAMAVALEDLETVQERIGLLIREATKRGDIALAVEA